MATKAQNISKTTEKLVKKLWRGMLKGRPLNHKKGIESYQRKILI